MILFIQTIMGRYSDNVSEVWAWFLPTIMPTLSLIIGVLVLEAVGSAAKFHYVDRLFFRLSFILSFTYLLLIAYTILLKPFSPLPAVELMKHSNLWLGPFQGLVSGSLGVFFLKGEK
jgi:hypothetical protein